MAKRKKTRKKSTRKKTTSRSAKRKSKRTTKKKSARKTSKRKTVKRKATKTRRKPAKRTKKAAKKRPARKAKQRTVVIARQNPRPHDGLVAFLLEFVVGVLGILGIGHIYNGKYSKGLFFMVGMWLYLLISLLILIATKGSAINSTLVPIILIIGLIIILSSAINAMKEARE